MSAGFNPFSGIGTAKPSLNASYVQPGEHEFKIKKLKLITSKRPGKVGLSSFIAEFETIKSVTPDGKPCHPVGSEVSWAVSLAQGDRALGDVKAFLVGCTGFEPTDIDEAISAASIHASNPFADVVVGCSAKLGGVNEAEGKKGFTRCSWRLVNQPADLADRIAKAGA